MTDTRATSSVSPPRRRPGLLYSLMRVFDLSLGEMLWSRRTIFMGLVVGLPVLMAAVIRLLHAFSAPAVRVNHIAVDGPAMFSLMIWLFYLRFSVPVLGVFYGTSLIADEVEDKTITYLFTRPISRGAVVLGKYVAYLVCTIFVVLPSVVVVWLAVVPIGGGLGAHFIDLLKDLALLAVGLAVYGALFAFIGAWFKRPLVAGLLFILFWEPAVLVFPGYLKNLTIAYYVQGLVPEAMPSADIMSLIQGIVRVTPTFATSALCLVAMEVLFLMLAARLVSRKEYVLEQ
jgi:ABC-type transport system involved in multi-copper enzyme maturation permease subunit